LQKEFKLTNKQALDITRIKDKHKYSAQVVEICEKIRPTDEKKDK